MSADGTEEAILAGLRELATWLAERACVLDPRAGRFLAPAGHPLAGRTIAGAPEPLRQLCDPAAAALGRGVRELEFTRAGQRWQALAWPLVPADFAAGAAPAWLLVTYAADAPLPPLLAAWGTAAAKLAEFDEHLPAFLYQTAGPLDGSAMFVPFANQYARELFGIEPDAVRREPTRLIAAIHPDDRPDYYEQALAAMRTQSEFRCEFRLVSAGGGERWVLAVSRPRLTGADFICFTGVAIDITALHHREAHARAAREEMSRFTHEQFLQTNDINARLRQEIATREQAEVALRAEERRLRRLLNLQDRERRLLAYELHDGLLQHVIGAGMLLEGALHAAGESADPRLAQIAAALDQAVLDGRRMIGELRPPELDHEGLHAALARLIAATGKLGIDADFRWELGARRLPPLLEATVFRIVQESLTNVRRHAQATRVEVSLALDGERLRIDVRDDGVGFELDAVEEEHYGLEGIRERARLFGGRAEIDSAPGRGTRVTVELPLPAAP